MAKGKKKDEEKELALKKRNELMLLQNFSTLRSAQDQVLWSIFGAFWSANALLLVSIFTAIEKWEKLVTILIPSIGIFISLVWLLIQNRTISRIRSYEDSISKIETQHNFEDHLRTFSKKPPSGIKAREVMELCVYIVMIGWIVGLCFAISRFNCS